MPHFNKSCHNPLLIISHTSQSKRKYWITYMYLVGALEHVLFSIMYGIITNQVSMYPCIETSPILPYTQRKNGPCRVHLGGCLIFRLHHLASYLPIYLLYLPYMFASLYTVHECMPVCHVCVSYIYLSI